MTFFYLALALSLNNKQRLIHNQFHCHRAAFSSQFKTKVGNILAETAPWRVNLNLDDTPQIASKSHTHPSHSQTSRLKYLTDYNNRTSNDISFMPPIPSTSGRIHSEFVRLLFLQAHRETDRFFAASGVQLPQTNRGLFHYRRAAFSSQLKSRVANILTKAEALRINLNIDDTPLASRSHTHPSLKVPL